MPRRSKGRAARKARKQTKKAAKNRKAKARAGKRGRFSPVVPRDEAARTPTRQFVGTGHSPVGAAAYQVCLAGTGLAAGIYPATKDEALKSRVEAVQKQTQGFRISSIKRTGPRTSEVGFYIAFNGVTSYATAVSDTAPDFIAERVQLTIPVGAFVIITLLPQGVIHSPSFLRTTRYFARTWQANMPEKLLTGPASIIKEEHKGYNILRVSLGKSNGKVKLEVKLPDAAEWLQGWRAYSTWSKEKYPGNAEFRLVGDDLSKVRVTISLTAIRPGPATGVL